MNAKTSRARQRGVTLIELVVVMAILAILSTLAVSSYRSYTLRAQRTDAQNALLRIQVAQEKHFLQNNTYTTDIVSAPPTGLGLGSNTTPGGYYTLAVAADAGGIGTSYIATATATGGQTQDKAACLTLTINDRGQRTPLESTGCWR
jgi:type IV pilus assembly protein PilE